MRYWDDIKKCKCFACGKVYDIYDLVIIEHKCSFNKDPNEALIKDRFYLKEKLAEYVYKESDVATQAKDFLFGLSIMICLQLIE